MYLIYLRMLSCFRIEGVEGVDGRDVDVHPVRGVEDPTMLVSVPVRYRVRLVPRDEQGLKRALREMEGEGEKK